MDRDVTNERGIKQCKIERGDRWIDMYRLKCIDRDVSIEVRGVSTKMYLSRCIDGDLSIEMYHIECELSIEIYRSSIYPDL